MKTRMFLLMVAIMIGLAGMTVAGINQQRQTASQALLAAAQLTEIEAQNILHMREEEKLARDVYLVLYEQWDADVFARISTSEQRHMDAVKRLVTIYGLVDPVVDDTVGQFTNPIFTELFNQYVADGSASLQEALMVGIAIEELDIEDLNLALQETTKRNVTRVFRSLLRGSNRHLAAFQRCLDNCESECPGPIGQGDGTCLLN